MRQCFIFFVFISAAVNGQLIEKIKLELSHIQTPEQANKYLSDQGSLTGQLIELNALVDTTEFERQLLSVNPGTVIDFDSEDNKSHFFFKPLESSSVKFYRVQYIFLDNSKLDLEQIDNLRKVILTKIGQGESFAELAKQYSMDGNAKKGGDLGWFEEGMMRKEFEEGIKSNKTDDVFKVDIPSEKWYYVVKNSHEPRLLKKVTVLYLVIKNGS